MEKGPERFALALNRNQEVEGSNPFFSTSLFNNLRESQLKFIYGLAE